MSTPEETRARAERLWRELSAPLRGWFARRALRGPLSGAADVDDLVQETFLRVQRALPSLREDEHVAGWIQRIAGNVWIDARRKHAPEALAEEREEDLAAREADPGAHFEREVAAWVATAIDGLDEVDRAILARTELRQIPHRAVAEELALSLDVVKARVRRGRAKLKARLEDCCALEFDARGRLASWRKKPTRECDCP